MKAVGSAAVANSGCSCCEQNLFREEVLPVETKLSEETKKLRHLLTELRKKEFDVEHYESKLVKLMQQKEAADREMQVWPKTDREHYCCFALQSIM